MCINKIFIIILFLSNLYGNSSSIDAMELIKIKKLVEKEEQIAKAYKDYISHKANVATSVDELISSGYLDSEFDKINPFTGLNIKLASENEELEENLPVEIKSKSFLYDYYYSNVNREHTKAPLGKQSKLIEIPLSLHEKYFLKYKDIITTDYANKNGKYYLDNNGILHWYDSGGNYKFSFGSDLIIDSSVEIIDTDGNITTEFKNLIGAKEATYAGQVMLHIKDGVAKEYINLGEEGGIIKIGESSRDIGKTIVQFTRRSGGIIINGDIYTWGNNANRITSIDLDNYTKENSGASNNNRYPVITSLVRARVKTYNNSIDNLNYYSSPLRPKFIDFFSTVYHSTCGVTTKGELYCGGSTGADSSALFTNTTTENNKEVLYRSTYFDGSSNKKATKVFANNQLWLILGNTNTDSNGGYRDGKIYRWGSDFAGFSGVSSNQTWKYNNTGNPTELEVNYNNSKVLFKDLTYLLTIGYRKMGALSNEGDVWIWGLDDYYTENCHKTINGQSINLCIPYRVDSTIVFSSLKGGLQGFVAKGNDGNYYKIFQKWGALPKVESITDMIKSYDGGSDNKYIQDDDADILAVDLSSRLSGSSLIFGEGIVWINGKNELKGDYFTADNKNDTVFKSAIKKIKWKNIKVVEDENAMCGIDIYNQMYCWGVVSFYREGTDITAKTGNTFMIPVFNTNLYDLDKDYLVTEGGQNGYLTNMTSGEWATTDSQGNSGVFFMKYPTYIGGFNYEFTFK